MSNENNVLDNIVKFTRGPQRAIAWHLIDAKITKNRVLEIQIEQKVSAGVVASMTHTEEDYTIIHRRGNNRSVFLFGIFAGEACEKLMELMDNVEDYDSVTFFTCCRDVDSGRVLSSGLVRWSEGHSDLRIRHGSKTKRFGWPTYAMRVLEAA